jgi:hypothetical protein
MTTITIDNKQYDLASLSDEVKSQLASIQFVDSELARTKPKLQRFKLHAWLIPKLCKPPCLPLAAVTHSSSNAFD